MASLIDRGPHVRNPGGQGGFSEGRAQEGVAASVRARTRPSLFTGLYKWNPEMMAPALGPRRVFKVLPVNPALWVFGDLWLRRVLCGDCCAVTCCVPLCPSALHVGDVNPGAGKSGSPAPQPPVGRGASL